MQIYENICFLSSNCLNFVDSFLITEMIIFKTKNELSSYLSHLPAKTSIGFVPTMGALHKGHLILIERAKTDCSVVICSIFVNPAQFNNKEDFDKYPNSITKDITQLEKINCDVIYTPAVSDLYAENEQIKHYDFDGLDKPMEGKFRKEHFDAVATIIEKFFEIIAPKKAYFGQKDLQQLLIVKSLTKKRNLPVEIVEIPTIREENGLAMSSRNNLLNKKQLETASLIYNSLIFCKENKELHSIGKLKTLIQRNFAEQNDVRLEYVAFVDASTLQSISKFQEKDKNAICIAAFVGNVRLIDNIIF